MVSWDIVLGLIIIALSLPFVFLSSKMTDFRRRARATQQELRQLRYLLAELDDRVKRDQSLILEAMGVPFLLMRPSGRVVMANREAAELFEIDPLPQNNLLRLLPEDSKLHSLLTKSIRHEEKVQATLQICQPRGERTYNVTATPLNTREHYIGVVFSDITEEHRTQIIRRDFVANASHELRSPLTIILGYLETLMDDPEQSPDMRLRALTTMKRHADRMARLVTDMLMLSRVETADPTLIRQEDFDLAQSAAEVIQRLEPVITQQKAEMEVDITPTPFPMRGESFYWSQVLFNLLENALKNNPTPGLKLRLQAHADDDGTRHICVEDNGTGIAPETLPYIFNRFYRADSTGRIKGTGLGLAIVKHAVDVHGGTISATSQPGESTRFCITLPPAPPRSA